MPRRAPLRTSSPSHPRLESGTRSGTRSISLMRPIWMPFVFSLKHSLHKHDQIDQQEGEKL